MNCVYILASQKRGSLYTGSTSDPLFRLNQHRCGEGSKHVWKYKIFRLVWFEIADDMDAALTREQRIKHWPRRWKFDLIEKMNPNWMDLTEELKKGYAQTGWE